MGLSFGYVPPPFGPQLWGQVVALLDKAVKRGNDWAEVVEWLEKGSAQLWLGAEDGVPVFAGVSVIDGDVLEIWLAGGALLPGGVQHLETVVEASKAAGTVKGRLTGRKGWARVLKPYGWAQSGEDLVKDWANG